jgi:hypothetical protein
MSRASYYLSVLGTIVAVVLIISLAGFIVLGLSISLVIKRYVSTVYAIDKIF